MTKNESDKIKKQINYVLYQFSELKAHILHIKHKLSY